MIAPLNVKMMMLTQAIHDDVSTRPSIIDVSQDMKLINRQLLDNITQGYDKRLCPTRLKDTVDDTFKIGLFVII